MGSREMPWNPWEAPWGPVVQWGAWDPMGPHGTSHEIFQDISWSPPGSHGNSRGTPWNPWEFPFDAIGDHGNAREPMELHGDYWETISGAMETHGGPWEPMGTHSNCHRNPWRHMGNSMGSYWFPRDAIESHVQSYGAPRPGIPWDPMGPHGTLHMGSHKDYLAYDIPPDTMENSIGSHETSHGRYTHGSPWKLSWEPMGPPMVSTGTDGTSYGILRVPVECRDHLMHPVEVFSLRMSLYGPSASAQRGAIITFFPSDSIQLKYRSRWCLSVGFHGTPWTPTRSYRRLSDIMASHGLPWDSPQTPIGIPANLPRCSTGALGGIPWNPMEWHSRWRKCVSIRP